MTEPKMTHVLLSTSHFIATITYPYEHNSTKAVLEISPVIHAGRDTASLADLFFENISKDSTSENRKKKREYLYQLLELLSIRQLEEIHDNIHAEEIPKILKHATSVLICLLDREGTCVLTRERSSSDVQVAIEEFQSLTGCIITEYHNGDVEITEESHDKDPIARKKRDFGFRKNLDCSHNPVD